MLKNKNQGEYDGLYMGCALPVDIFFAIPHNLNRTSIIRKVWESYNFAG